MTKKKKRGMPFGDDWPYCLDWDYKDKLPQDAREWLDKYTKAFGYGNRQELQELADGAGLTTDRIDEMRGQMDYERNYFHRNMTRVYTRSRFSEMDYNPGYGSTGGAVDTSPREGRGDEEGSQSPNSRKKAAFKLWGDR